jgi:hypothetical protein
MAQNILQGLVTEQYALAYISGMKVHTWFAEFLAEQNLISFIPGGKQN